MSISPVKKPAALLREQSKILRPGNFQASEFARARFDAVMPADWEYEEALKPGFWANICHLLREKKVSGEPDRTGSLIDLSTEDHAFFATLYVRGVMQGGLIVQCIGPATHPKTCKACPVDLETGLPWTGRAPVRSDKFDLRWNTTKKGYDIVRLSDQQVVADGSNFKTREMALEWITKTSGSNAYKTNEG